MLYCLIGALCLCATLYDFIFIMMTPDPKEAEAEDRQMNGNGYTNGDLRKSSGADTEILITPHEKSAAPEHSK